MPFPRHNIPEQMDQPDLSPDLLAGDLENLATLNRLFGGRAVLRRWLPSYLVNMPDGWTIQILDVGSGAGDLCAEILQIAQEVGREVRLVSLDYHPQVQAHARQRLGSATTVRFIRGDARALPLPDRSVDLALCTLALHHFSYEDAVTVLRELRRVTRGTVLVSDLIRSRLAYAAVWFATRFMANPMTRFDGPVSVRRAFTGSELEAMARQASWVEPHLAREGWFRGTLMQVVHWPGAG